MGQLKCLPGGVVVDGVVGVVKCLLLLLTCCCAGGGGYIKGG